MHRLAAQRARANATGFTLIELLVVMMIIVIGASALRPNIMGFTRGAQERTALRQLVSLFVAARTEAVTSGKLIRVVYDSASGSFYAEVQSEPQQDRQLFDPLPLMGRSEVRLPEFLGLESIEVGGMYAAGTEAATVYFYPDGRTDGAAIVLLTSSGGTASLEIAPATGRVRLNA